MKKLLLLLLVFPFVLGSCSSSDDDKNNILLNETSTTLKSSKTYQIKATSSAKISYVVENEYHAKVSESGLVTAGKIGVTNIVLTNGDDTKSFKVTVEPESKLYPEPNVEFGTSRADLIKKLGTPDVVTDSGIGYNNYSTNAPTVLYLFDSNSKLSGSSVMVKTTYSKELGVFLGERYVYATSVEKDYTLFFINGLSLVKTTMAIGSYLYNTQYWMVLYYPYSDKSKTSKQLRSSSEKESNIQAIDDLMKLMK